MWLHEKGIEGMRLIRPTRDQGRFGMRQGVADFLFGGKGVVRDGRGGGKAGVLLNEKGVEGMRQGVADLLLAMEGVGEMGSPGFGGNVGGELGVAEKRGRLGICQVERGKRGSGGGRKREVVDGRAWYG